MHHARAGPVAGINQSDNNTLAAADAILDSNELQDGGLHHNHGLG